MNSDPQHWPRGIGHSISCFKKILLLIASISISRHYELYRKERLKQMGFSEETNSSSSFAETYTLRRENHLNSLQQREEEMRQKFVLRWGP
jgi:septin family protein